MAKIHVLLTKHELDQQRLAGKVVIVLDVLFATTSIVTALAHGAKEVMPLMSGADVLAEAEKRRPETYLLSGELNAETLPGFCHPTPLALLREKLMGRTLLYCTTNGTIALQKSQPAAYVYAAALLNGRAVVEHVLREHRDHTVLLVCAGSADNFNLEDFYGAGHLLSLFRTLAPQHYEFSDAALAACLLYARHDASDVLSQSRIGRMMLARNLAEELSFAAKKDYFTVVPQLVKGMLHPV